MKKEIFVTEEASGDRVDKFLSEQCEEYSRSFLQKLMKSGGVFADGRPVKASYRVSEGDRLTFEVPEAVEPEILAENIPLDILYEDRDVILVNKPKGMVVHPAAGNEEGTLVNALLHHCGDSLSGIGGELRPGIVHRIDKDTSGLLIVAKNDSAHRALSEQLSDHSLHREYEAVVLGRLREEEGTIDKPLGRSPKDRKKMAVVPDGKRAVTHYRVLGRYQGYTHVLCCLETGRTHQIRVHMASLGHPIAGDPVYGSRGDKSGLQGQCLHARRLIFRHPRTGEEMRLECPLPQDFAAFLAKLRKESEE